MPARSRAEYIESIKKEPPCVYLGGRRVTDVTAEGRGNLSQILRDRAELRGQLRSEQAQGPVARRPNGHLPRNVFACRISGRSLSAFPPSVTSWE